MHSLSYIIRNNLEAVAAGQRSALYTGEAPDPGHPWTVVLSIADAHTEYTVVNNTSGEERITTTDTDHAHAVARALNLTVS